MYVHFPTRRLAAGDSASSLRLSLWSDACTQRSAQHDPAGCTVTHHDGANGAMNPMPAFTISPSCYTFLFLMPPPHSGRSSSIESAWRTISNPSRGSGIGDQMSGGGTRTEFSCLRRGGGERTTY